MVIQIATGLIDFLGWSAGARRGVGCKSEFTRKATSIILVEGRNFIHLVIPAHAGISL